MAGPKTDPRRGAPLRATWGTGPASGIRKEVAMKHEKSRIYLTSRELISDASVVVGKLPPGFGFLADQLRRASSSVLLNFSEGSRHSSLKERRRFFTMSAGSAAEVSAIADVAQGFGAIGTEEHAALKNRCNHICAMLRLYR